MTTCWLEIDTGSGVFFKVEDFGQFTDGMQVLINLIGNPKLLTDLNTQTADNTKSAIEGAIEQLRQTTNSVATAAQTGQYDPLMKYFSHIRDACDIHSLCVFRCVAGQPALI
jgi:hypothetical protein